MNALELIQVGVGLLTIFGFIFGAYLYLRNPTIKLSQVDAVLQVQLKTINDSVITLREDFNKKLANIEDNHIHTLTVKLDMTNEAINKLALQVNTLATIINERIPKK